MVDPNEVEQKMRTLRFLGDPYTDEDIAGARAAVSGHTEIGALIAYLQGLGVEKPATPIPAESPDAEQGKSP
jgi:cytochrome c oxidase cbb3-type subunit 2